jgi:hypothetical protein
MLFQQPEFLWALPAVLLPLIIHLLNRLRYRTVKWAAMMFLLTANRQATRRAKIRQVLLLLFRMLILFFFIWAMIRPIAGGWLATASGSSPEAIILLFDRSSSMEAKDANKQTTKREHALEMLATAARENKFSSRFVLIENATREPIEVADPGQLKGLALTGPTDTAADIPSLFRDAIDYILRNKPGSVEIWVVSDLQESNWRPESPDWQDVSARFGGLTQKPVVRILDLSGSGQKNLALQVVSSRLGKPPKPTLQLSLDVQATEVPTAPVPLVLVKNGARNQQDIEIKSNLQRVGLNLANDTPEGGYGFAELPADDNPRDNFAYYVYRPDPVFVSYVVASDPTTGSTFTFAAAPDPESKSLLAESFTPANFSPDWNTPSLVIWQGPAPTNEKQTNDMLAFIKKGGVVLAVPPGQGVTQGPLGLAWSALESAPEDAPWKIANWDEQEGPLMKSEGGKSLPVDRTLILQRQVPLLPANEESPVRIYGTFSDGKPFLAGVSIGKGRLLAMATLPGPAWSNVGNGVVLLPVVQRLLREGGQRLAPPAAALVGFWKPAETDGVWTPVDGSDKNWRWEAGIYQQGNSTIALNRPPEEDINGTVDPAALPPLLPEMKVDVMQGALEQGSDSLQSEIWPLLIMAAMIFMIGEMIVATSKAMFIKKAP